MDRWASTALHDTASEHVLHMCVCVCVCTCATSFEFRRSSPAKRFATPARPLRMLDLKVLKHSTGLGLRLNYQ